MQQFIEYQNTKNRFSWAVRAEGKVLYLATCMQVSSLLLGIILCQEDPNERPRQPESCRLWIHIFLYCAKFVLLGKNISASIFVTSVEHNKNLTMHLTAQKDMRNYRDDTVALFLCCYTDSLNKTNFYNRLLCIF